jgi:hypothetical protein
MTIPADSERAIDGYLAALRKQLRDLMEEDVNDIVEEIRAHVLDKTTAGADLEQVEQTLAALGTPAALASRYRTEELMKRAQAHRTGAQRALLTLKRVLAVAGGLLGLAVSVAGYCLGGGLVAFGVMKIFRPHGTGLWASHSPGCTYGLSFSSGSGNTPPHNSHDVLGWWLVPLGLGLGTALLYAAYRLGNWVMRMLRERNIRRCAASEEQVQS